MALSSATKGGPTSQDTNVGILQAKDFGWTLEEFARVLTGAARVMLESQTRIQAEKKSADDLLKKFFDRKEV